MTERLYEKLIAWQESFKLCLWIYTLTKKLPSALCSLEELHCQCRIALGLSYITEEDFKKADEHIHRVSYLINKLRSSVL